MRKRKEKKKKSVWTSLMEPNSLWIDYCNNVWQLNERLTSSMHASGHFFLFRREVWPCVASFKMLVSFVFTNVWCDFFFVQSLFLRLIYSLDITRLYLHSVQTVFGFIHFIFFSAFGFFVLHSYIFRSFNTAFPLCTHSQLRQINSIRIIIIIIGEREIKKKIQ